MQLDAAEQQQWVLLSYRLPREPSTPRLAVWRKLRDLGVAQLGDGLVALPFDARTKEHFEWIAASVAESHGEAVVWIAVPAAWRSTETLVGEMRAARDAEYRALIDEASSLTPGDVDGRTLARLRRTMRDIGRRDYFRAPARAEARRAVERLRSTTQPTAARPRTTRPATTRPATTQEEV